MSTNIARNLLGTFVEKCQFILITCVYIVTYTFLIFVANFMPVQKKCVDKNH